MTYLGDKHKRGSDIGQGATYQYQKEKIMGRNYCHPGQGTQPCDSHYHVAQGNGHQVLPMIHDTFGAWCQEGVSLMYRLGEIRENRLDKEFHDASWTERSFTNYYVTRCSVALHFGVAAMVLQGARCMHKSTNEEGVVRVPWKRYKQKVARGTAG